MSKKRKKKAKTNPSSNWWQSAMKKTKNWPEPEQQESRSYGTIVDDSKSHLPSESCALSAAEAALLLVRRSCFWEQTRGHSDKIKEVFPYQLFPERSPSTISFTRPKNVGFSHICVAGTTTKFPSKNLETKTAPKCQLTCILPAEGTPQKC